MLGPRLKKAKEIAAQRARRLAVEGAHDVGQHDPRLTPPSKKHPHREASQFEPGYLKKWSGRCDCDRCKEEKRRRYKGEQKRRWRETHVG
jgi:hypothetical protein